MTRTSVMTAIAALALSPLTLAGHDKYRPATPRIAELAHEVATISRELHRDAEHVIYPERRFEHEALAALHDFETRARHFHRSVEHGKSPRHLERDYGRLLDAFDRAAAHVVHVRSRHIRRGLFRAERAIDRLDRAVRYELRAAYRDPRGGSYGDRDRDRRRPRVHGRIILGDRHYGGGYHVDIGVGRPRH